MNKTAGLPRRRSIPGMTETSLYPQAAAVGGISFPELLDKITQSALNLNQR